MTTYELTRTLAPPDFLRPPLAAAMVLFAASLACVVLLRMKLRVKKRYPVLGLLVFFPMSLVVGAYAEEDDERVWRREEAEAMAAQWGVVVADPGQLPGLDVSPRRELDVAVGGLLRRCELASFQQDARDGTWSTSRITAKGRSSRTVRLQLRCPA
ncbi:hypothetical protein [Segniliparus rugosus]|uniref:Uncharacterized protein n=1 Tax=Segniliparus rugosus (strain ATCC BAA-974 / DSM 45345 / CCUG 50838 / CIP 108380 / JCM 13579 / CDC 945) TaxID=679197 RepID=E5XM17_SEGRC|nr:hypothetical protein [Segniliparus rugosus]EFV14623.1 hypothetical protein HMPREF9336_00536 [Segniliparus rugosus ATCC BAA-974]